MLTRSKEVINGLSEKLEADFKKKFDALPAKIKYKFDYERRNPDPQKTGGEFIYPSWKVLEPVTFYIKDPYDNLSKKIGLVIGEDAEGNPNDFKRITLQERDRGVLNLKKDDREAFDTFCYLELHPANTTGKYRDNQIPALFKFVDESKEAKSSGMRRNLKADAMFVAANMKIQEMKDFAVAMDWDETMDEDILFDKIGEIAENDPTQFKVLIESSSMEYKATVKRAEVHQIIEWDSQGYKYVWATTKETIIAFGRQENMDRLEKMAEWLLNKREVYDKLKSLLKAAKIYTT